MFRYTQGDILQAPTEAVINTVNTVGVMGKGIALAFRKKYPGNYKKYRQAYEAGELQVGKMLVYETDLPQPRWIINFPTKMHWRHPSKYEYITTGLEDLKKVIKICRINSISIPPLGCGNGGLDWIRVKAMILETLKDIAEEVEIVLYEAGFESQQRQVKPVTTLTPPRAMLLQLIRQYQMLGEEPNALVIQKLAYLMQSCGEALNLRYEKGYYGPFAHNLSKVIEALSPKYLQINGNISKPYTSVRLNPDVLPELKAYLQAEVSGEQKKRLDTISDLINGFENMLGLELLATVHYVMVECPDCTLEEIVKSIHEWTPRKKQILPAHHIEEAYRQLHALALV